MDIPSLAGVYEQALTQRPEIKSAELEKQKSDLQLKVARAGHMPTVNITGGVSTSTSSNNSKGWGELMKNNFDATAGVGVSIPLFDQRKTRTAINKAQLQQEKALLTMENERKELYQTIEGYWLDALSNQQKFRAAIVTVESEQQSYDLLSEQFQLGLKNIVELLRGQASLLKAKHDKLQSKYLTILSQQLLYFYQGDGMTL